MKITFIGAGSTVFARNVIGDCILTPELGEFDVCLFDIDAQRLEESYQILSNINATANGKAHITRTLDRETAFKGADFVVNAIQVGGYEPCTVTDFEIPKKYGLRQTIADTLGIGGIFRTLRTIPVMKSYADDMERWCPNALFLNYTNPMAMLSGYMQRYTNIRTVGLCHSVQGCASGLLQTLGMDEYVDKCRWEIAGINHQAWLLKIEDPCGNDLYPEIKRRAASPDYNKEGNDLVRLKMMQEFGYYITESSEHTSEYTPWFIKEKYPELIDRYKIPLDEYPRRCVNQIKDWKEMSEKLLSDTELSHERSKEYASYIMESVITGAPLQIGGNVLNTGHLIEDFPEQACVEVPCLVNGTGVHPTYVGHLPPVLAAMNMTNINTQLLTIEAARTRKKEDILRAVMLEPHTAAELSIDDMAKMIDELIEAHGEYMAMYH